MRKTLLIVVAVLGCETPRGHVNDYDEDCLPKTPGCFIPVQISSGVQLVRGEYRQHPWESSRTYCGISCMSPAECTTADDCTIDVCTFSECIDGRCVNVAYPDGDSCIGTDPWTGEPRVGACDGCYCRPPYAP